MRRLTVLFLVAAGVIALGTWIGASERNAAPRGGVVMGFRFSGNYEHRCRLLIRPDGAKHIDARVLVEPNSATDCVNLRTFDRWERAR